jgi:hypothetical protein
MVKQFEDLDDLELEAAHPIIRRLVTAIEKVVENQRSLDHAFIQALKSAEVPEGWKPNGSVLVPACTNIPQGMASQGVVQLLGFNALRYDFTIVNKGDNAAVIFTSIPLQGVSLGGSGSSWNLRTKGSVFCYSLSGTTLDVVETVFNTTDRRAFDRGVSGNQPDPLPASFLR